MSLSPIIFCISSVDGSFVPINGAVLAWPQLFQGDTRDLQISIVVPTGNPNQPYTFFNGAGITMYVTMGAQPKGDGSQTIYAGPLAMTWNAALNAWQGSLVLTNANLATAIGTNASCPAFVGININSGGSPQNFDLVQITVFAPENPGGVVTPAPAVNYSTTAEANGLYVRNDGGQAGDSFIRISPNGTKYLIGINNDGTWNTQRLN